MEKNNKNNIFYICKYLVLYLDTIMYFFGFKMTFCFKLSEMRKETVLKKKAEVIPKTYERASFAKKTYVVCNWVVHFRTGLARTM